MARLTANQRRQQEERNRRRWQHSTHITLREPRKAEVRWSGDFHPVVYRRGSYTRRAQLYNNISWVGDMMEHSINRVVDHVFPRRRPGPRINLYATHATLDSR